LNVWWVQVVATNEPDEDVGPGEELDVEVLGVEVLLDPVDALGVGGHARAGQHPPPAGAVSHVVLRQHVDRLCNAGHRHQQDGDDEDGVMVEGEEERREKER
jgi:hypothetical protein